MVVIEFLVIAVIVVLGGWWYFARAAAEVDNGVFPFQEEWTMWPRRCQLGVILAGLVAVGSIVVAGFHLFDPKVTDFGFGSFLGSVDKSLIFAALFFLKSYVAILVATICVAYGAYSRFEHGELHSIPVFNSLLELVVD